MIIEKYSRGIFFLFLIVHLTEDFHTLHKSVNCTIHTKKNACKHDPDSKIKCIPQPHCTDDKSRQRKCHRKSQLGQPYKQTQFFQSKSAPFAIFPIYYTLKKNCTQLFLEIYCLFFQVIYGNMLYFLNFHQKSYIYPRFFAYF